MNKSRNNLIQLSGQLFLSNGKIGITDKKRAKEPSIISLFLLIFVTLSLYSFGIYQLSNGVSNFVDTVVQKVEQY
ncbi:MAG: hypothetical protein AB4372_31985 [Xenococcus sp. (in: cyanobacteria)]